MLGREITFGLPNLAKIATVGLKKPSLGSAKRCRDSELGTESRWLRGGIGLPGPATAAVARCAVADYHRLRD